MKARILLVEDDDGLRETTKQMLSEKGYHVTATSTAENALNLIQRGAPDLLISDVGLPGMSGIRLCEVLKGDRRTSAVPIILLTMLASETDKVRGLQQGADDYITKPFSIRELLARIESLMRRVQRSGETAARLQAGELVVDLDSAQATLRGRALPLRKMELDLLVLLMRNKGRLLTKDFIMEALWKGESIVTSNTINAHIRNLRRHLGNQSGMIETLIGQGYRLSDSGS